MALDSGWPASRFAALLDKGAQQNQNQLDADLQGYLSEEHRADGTHGAVSVQSLTALGVDGLQHPVGIFTDIPWDPSLYTATGSMTWTVALVSQLTLCYELVREKMTVLFYIQNSTVGGTPGHGLQIAVPLRLNASRFVVNACAANDAGTAVPALVAVVQSISSLAGNLIISRADNNSWSAGTTSVWGQITYSVVPR